ncbi:hypothetical protein TorRG33x02_049780, partial [Trema orientale]
QPGPNLGPGRVRTRYNEGRAESGPVIMQAGAGRVRPRAKMTGRGLSILTPLVPASSIA